MLVTTHQYPGNRGRISLFGQIHEILLREYAWFRTSPEAEPPLPNLLAARFWHDISQGGFSQLLFNLQGEYLHETEDMLIAAQASCAHAFFVRAIRICSSNLDAYQRFLASDYLTNNDVKHELQRLSIEYFALGIDFVDEIAAYVDPHCD